MRQLKHTTLLLMAGAVLAFSCSKTPSHTATPPSSTSALFTIFPHLDTATLWFNGVVGGTEYAKIASDGTMTIHSATPGLAGSFKIHLEDSTSGATTMHPYDLLRGGVDTVISDGCGISIEQSDKDGRYVIWMLVDGGNLPVGAIMRGVFLDSL